MDIYRYIDADSSEGQDILNLFFVAFNKYVGTDKNQVFTPDHITDFMCKVVGVSKNTRVFDGTCGSGSFLVQALCQAIADCKDDAEKEIVKKEHIFGVESEEKAYGLATTNMLIHGDGNSNIQFGSIFDEEAFIVNALGGDGEKVILMNPPYNAIPKDIPEAYKVDWGDAADGLEDPTKGLVFIQYISDVLKRNNISNVKLCVLLPVAVAIGGGKGKVMKVIKRKILEDNTLEAVFSLPDDIFYPSVSVNACCMLFTMNKPHYSEEKDGTRKPHLKTFFGYFKEDGFRKVKNIGRMDVDSSWKELRDEWLQLFRERDVEAGLSAKKEVTGDDEWLCEAYMETNYDKLSELDFTQTVRDYVSYLIKSPSTNREACNAS